VIYAHKVSQPVEESLEIEQRSAPAARVLRADDRREILIAPRSGWAPLELRELWSYRDLLYFLIWRILKVRYKQTVLGIAWAVIPAVATMVIFTLIFGRLVGVTSNGSPYALFSFAALVPWTYFANAVTQSTNSLVENERLLTKVYFPRLLLPLATTIASLLDFLVGFVVLVVLMFSFGVVPTAVFLTLPAFAALMVAAAFGVGLCLSALNVYYRDVRYATAFLIQFWLFATPVAYATSIIPTAWRPLFAVNPMVGVIDGFRWAVLENAPAPRVDLLISVFSVVVTLCVGLFYFRRVEDSFADVV